MQPVNLDRAPTRAIKKISAYSLVCLIASVMLSACGGSGSSANSSGNAVANSCTGSTCGSAMLSLTDAQGDFTTYTVNVVSLQLQRANGTTVETLPNTTSVDFATLVSLSEIVSNGQVPEGNYTGATITLDYSNANIVVDDGSATGLAVTAVDSNGNPLGQLTLAVQFDGNNNLVVNPGRISSLSLDFNLLASNTVNTGNATVTVNPVLEASLVPPATKPLRIRGALQSVDTSASTYTVSVRPFHDADDSLGSQVVNIAATTTFFINGTSYTGSAGLTQLASLADGTLVVAYGSVSTTDKTFTATSVLAGTSVASTTLQSIEGDVIARSGNIITLRGATLCGAGDRNPEFQRGDITVTVGSNTTVTEDGQSGTFTIQDISVGQHAQFFGTSSSQTSSSSSSSSGSSSSGSSSSGSQSTITFDATAGSARLMLTGLWGTVSSVGSDSVTLNLQALDGNSPSVFNFAGTGTSSASDATASAYIVGTGNLSLSGVTTNTAVRFLGFVAPFGSVAAGGADFNADTLVNYAQTNAQLVVSWGSTGTSTPFGALSTSSIAISQSALDQSDNPVVRIGPQRISLLSTAAHTGGITLIPPDATVTTTQYAIYHRATRSVSSYSSFTDFETALQTGVSASGIVTLGLAADGAFDATTSTLKANDVAVLLSN